MSQKVKVALAVVLAAILITGASLLIIIRSRRESNLLPTGQTGNVIKHRLPNPLWPAVDAYNAGHYKEAEAAAQQIADKYSHSKDPAKLRKSVEARYLLAFSSARQKKMRQARDRFEVLKNEAARLLDKGKQPPIPGAMQPTLEEEGAYQHAVCTAALGDKAAAEAEYMKFMRDYPDSPLISGALQRIGMLHNRHVPDYAEKAWKKANGIAVAHQRERESAKKKKWSMCGPLCASELLRRYGQDVDVSVLAKEMRTSENGTSMEAMANSLTKRDLPTRGFLLTQKGLTKQHFPLIALITPGHYVIVENVTKKEVTIWDPYGKGINKPSRTTITTMRWKMMWRGTTLVLINRKKRAIVSKQGQPY